MSRWITAGLVGATAFTIGIGTATTSGAPVPVPVDRDHIARTLAAVEMKQAEEQREEAQEDGDREGERGPRGEGPAAAQVEQRAYPKDYITSAQTTRSRRANEGLADDLNRRTAPPGVTPAQVNVAASWNAVGPVSPRVPAEVTYSGRQTYTSGRITALAIAPTCVAGNCRLWIAAAGGGIWRTGDALAAAPSWTAVDSGLTTNSFGSITVDPRDPTGNTLYAGSGEANGSADSEAGQGLFKTTNGGDSWTLVAGSTAVSKDAAIAAVLIPRNSANDIWIATTYAIRGSSAVSGGYAVPPGAPDVGVYRSTNNGATWTLQSALPAAGAKRLVEDPNHSGEIYAALAGEGIYRIGNSHDPAGWNKVFAATSDVDFDLADLGATTRIYVGKAISNAAELWVADSIDTASAASLVTAQGTSTAPWSNRSASTVSTPDKFSSYDWCQGQCWYDTFVEADPGNADIVYLGGAMNYDELFGRSNGRAVIRSENAGVRFTDMTNDMQSPPLGMHPDQHALVFNPNNTAQVFVGSDGGLVRTSGAFGDASATCDSRGLTSSSLTFCRNTLGKVPTLLTSLNNGLNTLQFQSVSLHPTNPYTDVIGGTQDNGTWAWDGTNWFESVGGDGGNSGISSDGSTRIHNFYSATPQVNTSTSTTGWRDIYTPLQNSSDVWPFYPAFIADPTAAGTYFVGGNSVWRTKASGGPGSGDWVKAGPVLNPTYAVAALARASSDSSTLWVGMANGDIYVSKNADAATASAVTFTKVGSALSGTINVPNRFVSGIAVDPANANHVWISYSGYGSNTPSRPGHIYEATYTAGSPLALTDKSHDIGDQPVTGVAFDGLAGDLYAATDFGVARLAKGTTTWTRSADGLPLAAAFSVTINASKRVAYTATHGRGVYQLPLNPAAVIVAPGSLSTGTAASFQSTGSVGFKGLTAYRWDFPDGTSSPSAAASYVPKVNGSQDVRLTVTDSLGHTSTTTKTVTVGLGPLPTLTGVTPSSGPTAGGYPLTLTGTGFVSGASVTVGGQTCPVTGVTTSTTLTCTAPLRLSPGSVSVTVTNPDTQQATRSNAFTYLRADPSLSSISPTSGPVAGGTTITVRGTDLEGSTVSLGGSACALQAATGSTITCRTSSHSAGAVDVVVTRDDSKKATLAAAFTYLDPEPTPSVSQTTQGPDPKVTTPAPDPSTPVSPVGPQPVTGLKAKPKRKLVRAWWSGDSPSYRVVLTGRSTKGKKVTKRATVTSAAVRLRVSLKKRSAYRVCVVAVDAVGVSAQTCVRGRFARTGVQAAVSVGT